jgi:Domain of unknown function (DUF4838)
MRGARLAAVAMLLVCLTVAASCQSPVSISVGASSHSSVAVAWWSADRSPVAPFAASELARYLTRMSGVEVNVLPGSFATTPPPRVAAALVLLTGGAAAAAPDGGSMQLDSAWIAGPTGRLGSAAGDGFATEVLQGDTAAMVAADQRGILYAAYDLLEQLGLRFFAPDFVTYRGMSETVPRRSVVLPTYRTAQQAGLTSRTLDLDEGWSVSTPSLDALIDWMGKSRMNVLAIPTNLDLSHYDAWRVQIAPLVARRGILLEVGQHGFQLWLPQSRYPQYYYYDYTVFDITNERAVTTYVNSVVAYLAQRPEIAIFDAWPPDGATWPPSVVQRFGSPSNAQAYLVGRLTQELAARLPRVRVETIAYQATDNPPTAPYGYDPQRNIVDVAMDSRAYGAPISAAVNAGSATTILRWRQVFGGDVGVYEYYRKYLWRSLAFPLGDVIGSDLAWYAQRRVTGIRTYAEPGDWITYELTHLVVASAAWNPGQNPGALVAGYVHERFGAAADAVGRYVSAAEAAGDAAFGGAAPQLTLSDAVADYGVATADLSDAAAFVGPSSPAAFLIQRLGWNADFSVADSRLTASLAAGDAVAALQARTAGTALLQAHSLDGILVDNPRYQYGQGSRSNLDYAREYSDGIVFSQPAGTVTLSPGATVELELTAEAAGATAQRATWRLNAGAGLAIAPAAGSLAVARGGPATATVKITAGRELRRVHVGLTVRSGDVQWAASGFDVVIADGGDLAPYRDSVAVTSEAALTEPTFDGKGCGYSQQALAAAGLVSGGRVSVDGVSVPWPRTNGSADNVVADGQQLTLPPSTRGSRLVFLATATAMSGEALGAGSVTYAGGGGGYYQMAVPDWQSADTVAGARVIARGAYHTCGLRASGPTSVYAVEVRVDPSRDISSITLPLVFGEATLHIFSLAVG